MRLMRIRHEFVEYIPSELDEGVFYVSIPYALAVHKCACGCGNKVVTPFSPAEWQLTFDGDSVSLSPSIGNWGFPCRSHYWIKEDTIRWAAVLTNEQIADGRSRDVYEQEQCFARRAAESVPEHADAKVLSLWGKIRRWFGR